MATISADLLGYLRRLATRRGSAASDALLLRRWIDQRDQQAFADLVARHGSMVLRTCLRLVGDSHAAEDCAQATFLVLARKAASVWPPETVPAWLHGVACRVARRSRALAARRRSRETQPAPASPPPRDALAELTARELLTLLDEEVARLPAAYRLPVVLCCLEGRSQEETARLLGWSPGSVKGRLERGRARLRKRLARRGVELPAVLLAAGVGEGTAAAAMPAALATSTVQVAIAFVADSGSGAVTAGMAAELARHILAGAIGLKAKLVTAFVVLGALVGGAGMFAQSKSAPKSPNEPREATPVPQAAVANAAPTDGDDGIGRYEPKTRIVGVVVDEAGRPIQGANVNVVWFRKAVQDVKSAADGSFTLELGFPTTRSESVRASADGGARQGTAQYDESFSTVRSPVRIVLKPARTVTVHVTDSKGTPVGGAAVSIQINRHGTLVQAVTKADGSADFRVPAEAQQFQVVALKPGLGFDVFDKRPPVPGQRIDFPNSVSLALNGARRVELKAIDTNGQPVAWISCYPLVVQKKGQSFVNIGGHEIVHATTGADGIARFDWIPKQVGEAIIFTGYSSAYYVEHSANVEPSETNAATTLDVLRKTRIQGTVWLPDGSPAAGVLVHAFGDAGRANRDRCLTRTTRAGTYSMWVAPELEYMIGLLDPRGAAPALSGITVRGGVPPNGLDLRMIPGTVVRGRATSGTDGKPAANERITVAFTGHASLFDRWTFTDQDGRYSVRLAPGSYQLSAESSVGSVEVRVTGQQEIVRDISDVGKSRERVTLAGVVVDRTVETPRPVADAEIREIITRTTGLPPAKAVADAQGRFELTTGIRPQLVYARSKDGSLAGFLEVPMSGPAEIPLFAAATVLGRVTDPDGRPIRSRRVRFGIFGGAGAFELEDLFSVFDGTRTDSSGAYLCSGLPPNAEGWIAVEHKGGPTTVDRNPYVRQFKVRGPEPIVLTNVVVPSTSSSSAIAQNPGPAEVAARLTNQPRPKQPGRPVIGRLVAPAGNRMPIDWSHGASWIQSNLPAIKPPDGLTEEDRSRWYERWAQSEAGKAYAQARRAFRVLGKPDGSFRVEDVPAGSYILSIRLTQPPDPRQRGLVGRLQASVTRTFAVSGIADGRTAEPVDLGELDFNGVKRLRVGDLAPPFEIETVDGKGTLKLSDYRGKYVLLHFWAIWCRPCHYETPHLKEVYEAFGGNKRFAMIGISWDNSPEDALNYVAKNGLAWAQGFLGNTQVQNPGGKIIQDYRVGLPFILLIGPDGRIVARDLQGATIKKHVAEALGTPP